MRKGVRRTIFMHIPKCGGSSFVSAAKSYLGTERSGRVVLLDDFMPPAVRREKLARAKDALFVSGHFGFETLQEIRKDAFVFTILRDPFERLRSTYGYMTALKDKNPLPEHLKRLSIDAFIASRDEAVLQWTDNVIARAVAQTCDRSQLTFQDIDTMTDAAVKNLRAFDHIGFLESLHQDMPTIAATSRVATFDKVGHKNSTESHLRGGRRPEATARMPDDLRRKALPLLAGSLRVYEAALELSKAEQIDEPAMSAEPRVGDGKYSPASSGSSPATA